MLSRLTFLVTVGLLALSVTTLPTANATQSEPPQVLGLIATTAPTPLNCADGTCSGFFSAFCMQEKRPKPGPGQRYDLAGEGDVTLIVEQAGGRAARFSAAGLLDFISEGEYTSVRISLPMDRLASLDAKSVSVQVPRLVALVPRPAGDGATATREDDLEVATGPRRFAAEGFFEQSNPRADAALIMTRMINLLPPEGIAPARLRHRIWDKSVDGILLRALTGDGINQARDTFDRCNYYADNGYAVRLRGCLRKTHDELLKSLNKDYWESDAGL